MTDEAVTGEAPIRERAHSEKLAYLDGYLAGVRAAERLGVGRARLAAELIRESICDRGQRRAGGADAQG